MTNLNKNTFEMMVDETFSHALEESLSTSLGLPELRFDFISELNIFRAYYKNKILDIPLGWSFFCFEYANDLIELTDNDFIGCLEDFLGKKTELVFLYGFNGNIQIFFVAQADKGSIQESYKNRLELKQAA